MTVEAERPAVDHLQALAGPLTVRQRSDLAEDLEGAEQAGTARHRAPPRSPRTSPSAMAIASPGLNEAGPPGSPDSYVPKPAA